LNDGLTVNARLREKLRELRRAKQTQESEAKASIQALVERNRDLSRQAEESAMLRDHENRFDNGQHLDGLRAMCRHLQSQFDAATAHKTEWIKQHEAFCDVIAQLSDGISPPGVGAEGSYLTRRPEAKSMGSALLEEEDEGDPEDHAFFV
jgi:hypothetical protein